MAKNKKTWGDIYLSALKKGYDHGYAAYVADRYIAKIEKIDDLDFDQEYIETYPLDVGMQIGPKL